MSQSPIPAPGELKRLLPAEAAAARTVAHTRSALRREDHRLVAIVGPCSIHDPGAALEYGERLHALGEELGEHLLLVMRTYFEKPRTTLGWRGLLTDPDLDGSGDLGRGLHIARGLLLALNAAGVPCATESLDPMLAGYTEDLVSWSAIGARTAESQVHRALASGLPMPVGFKNGTQGAVGVAIDAVQTARSPQSLTCIDDDGRLSVRTTTGNDMAHVVLRGGSGGPNYERAAVSACERALGERGLPASIAIDCSHANCAKQPLRQLEVIHDLTAQLVEGDRTIVGLMIESHLHEGNQPLGASLSYGVSVTDPCLGWQDTAGALRRLHDAAGEALLARSRVRAVPAADIGERALAAAPG